MICDECQALYEEVGDRARKPDVFEKVRRTDDRLICKAKGIESEAFYVVEIPDSHDRVWIALQTPDRWLSESIEAELMFQGEKIEDLLEEELVDRGADAHLDVEHFRDEEKRYTFRSEIPLPSAEVLDGPEMIDRVTRVLLAYEATFRELGDMKPHHP
ncbi:MAG: hypothetical protein ACOC1G_05200 [Phycisphaeraceae bacterium]